MPKTLPATGKILIQEGRFKSHYRTRWTFEPHEAEKAVKYYTSLLVHTGFKKRYVDPEGKVLHRVIT